MPCISQQQACRSAWFHWGAGDAVQHGFGDRFRRKTNPSKQQEDDPETAAQDGLRQVGANCAPGIRRYSAEFGRAVGGPADTRPHFGSQVGQRIRNGNFRHSQEIGQ